MLRWRSLWLLPLLILAGIAVAAPAPAVRSTNDWPGWRGKDRTGLSTETGLLKEWPKGGPTMVWKITGLGEGYSTPSIAKGRIYLMGTSDKEERLIALDAKDGSQLWATPIGTKTGGYAAPKSTPTFDDDLLYVISSDG